MFILHLFRIRFIQLYRILLEIGLLRTIVVILFFSFLFLMINYFTNTLEGSIGVFVCSILLIYSIHTKRGDKNFLSKFTSFLPLILFTEYILLLSPIIFFMIFSAYPLMAVLLIGFVFLLSYSSFNVSFIKVELKFLKLIPAYNFEWISGMRKNYKVIFLFYILGILLSGFSYVSLFIIWILNFIFIDFYNNSEPLDILLIQNKNATQFLKWKLKTQLRSYLLCMLPLYILYSIWNYESWYISVVFFIVNLFCFPFLLLIKYASYIPNERNRINELIVLLVFISNFILPFLPFTIILYIKYGRKAISNLNFYLHDFN